MLLRDTNAIPSFIASSLNAFKRFPPPSQGDRKQTPLYRHRPTEQLLLIQLAGQPGSNNIFPGTMLTECNLVLHQDRKYISLFWPQDRGPGSNNICCVARDQQNRIVCVQSQDIFKSVVAPSQNAREQQQCLMHQARKYSQPERIQIFVFAPSRGASKHSHLLSHEINEIQIVHAQHQDAFKPLFATNQTARK